MGSEGSAICYFIALVCFAVAVILPYVPASNTGTVSKVNFIALGLFFFVLPFFVDSFSIAQR